MSVQGEIFEWVQEFGFWKQELFIRAAAAPQFSEKDAEEVAAMLLDEDGDGARPREIRQEDLLLLDGVDEPMAIEQITDLQGVNAIADGQTITFEPKGVNIVWGANGAGKTGYSRVLKKAGRTLYSEEVLSNVYGEGGSGPKATVVVKVGEHRYSEELDLEAEPPPLLARIHIADSRAGEVYLTKETEVDYVPTMLASLSRLASGLNAVRVVLERRRDAVEVPQIDPRAFGEGTRAAAIVASLAANTSEPDFRELAKLSEDEEARRLELRRTIAEIQAMQAPQLRATAEREAAEVTRLRQDLADLQELLDTPALDAWAEREKSLKEAREAAELIAKRFDTEPLGAIGSQPWRVLWNAAREYAGHLEQRFPPDHDPAYCPLCMQQLGEGAEERLRSFEEFVASDVNARMAGLERAKSEALARLPDVDVTRDRHRATVELLGGEAEKIGFAVKAWLDLVATTLARIRAGEVGELRPLGPPPNLEPWIEARNEEAKRQAGVESAEETEKDRAQLSELEGRRLLGERLAEVLGRLAALKEVARIEKAIGQTGTQAVSRKVGALSQELIQAGLEEALERQLVALEFRDIEVVPKARTMRGKPHTALAFKTVQGVALTAVLSQGEQRRLALAMFLAEMEVRSDVSPIVFDDPTSSIDQEGRRRIAKTLLRLGADRQVIVFTHELSLVRELQRNATTFSPVSVQWVRRIGRTVGHVQPSLPWEGLSPTDRFGDLDQRLVRLRALYEENDQLAYTEKVGGFCGDLRASFERAVEDLVLAGVVTRRSDDVQTKKLRVINWSPEICDLVDRGMSENSAWMHDRPLADGASPPAPDELAEGLKIYQELLGKTKELEAARKKDAKKRKRERKRELKAVETPLVEEKDGEPPERELQAVPDPEPGPTEPSSSKWGDGRSATEQLKLD
jgi:energy-coupling factor transporter ATP-binding protein EcfA2